LEVLSGTLSNDEAAAYYHGIMNAAAEIHRTTPVDVVMIWNGATVPGIALSDFAHEHTIKTLFFELSNIHGKLFVDPQGVNAASLLFTKPEILVQFGDVPDDEYLEWKETFLVRKTAELITPGALRNRSVRNYLFPLDLIGTVLFRLPGGGDMNPFRRAAQIFRQRQQSALDAYRYTERPYILYPMQVSSDSQLLLNSEVSNGQAITFCSERASALGIDLIVKLHPMESDVRTVHLIRSMTAGRPVYIVATSTMELILHAHEVVTINSTVGLEAMIAGKQVTFLGRSFFPALTGERLKQYLLRYLIHVDYYSDEPIPLETAHSIIQRADLR
jgi:capsular polysaccharide export protein